MADVKPWWNRIPSILAYPFSVTGIIAILAMTAASVLRSLGGLSPYGMLALLLGSGMVFSIIFLVIRESAKGATEFPAVDAIEDPFDDLIMPGLKVTILAIVLYLPAIYCAFQGFFGVIDVGSSMMMRGGTSSSVVPGGVWPLPTNTRRPSAAATPWSGSPDEFGDDVMSEEERESVPFFDSAEEQNELLTKGAKVAAWFLAAGVAAVLCSLIYPLCLIVLALSGSLQMALFPMTWFVILRQVPLGYLGVLFALGAGSSLCFAATLPFAMIPIPFLPGIAAAAIKMYFALCGAHLLGWFVYQNRARLGISEEPERRDISVAEVKASFGGPAAPQYRSAGMVRVGTAPNAAPGALAAGEVAGGPPAGWGAPQESAPGGDEIAGLHARFQAACVSRDIASAAASAPLLLDAYWQSGNVIGAVDVYRALVAVSPETSLGPERQGRIAKELEAAGDLQTAMTAWRTFALSHPDHPRAPTALWRCAEICGKLNRPDWVASACQAIIARYPMSEVAALAQSRMKKLGTG